MHKKLRIDYEKIARLLSVVVLLLTITVAILFGLLGKQTPTEAATDWYNPNWLYRQKISVDYTKVPNTDQTDFPVLLDLSDLSSGFFTNVQTDGGDIVVTAADGVTKLQRELVSINTGGSTGELWFKAPSLSSSVNTDFWIYYGNATANEGNSTAVWSNGYELVQHMNEDPSGSAPQMLDSTLNDNDGTSNGTMTSGDIEAGQIGNSIDYDASDDYIDYGGGINGQGDKLTVSAWINPDALVSSREYHILDNGNGYLPNVGTGGSFAFTTYNTSTTHKLYLYIMNNSSSIASAQGPVSGQITSGSWFYVTGVYDGTDIKVYINGVEKGTTSHSGDLDTTVSNLVSGKGLGGSQYYIDGNIDEVRLSGQAHTADWIATEYNNQNDPGTFFSFNTQETFSVGWYDNAWTYRQKITIDSTKVANTDQINFPVYVDLEDLGTGLFENAKSDGSDIVITGPDGTTKLSREVVDIDTVSETGELWFKSPLLQPDFDNIYYIYYGNTSASESNDTSVWSNGYELVQHMNEDPSGSAPQMLDSTSNGFNATSNGTMTSDDLISGAISTAVNLDGSDDYFTIGDNSTLDIGTSDFTMSAWMKTSTSGVQIFFDKYNLGADNGYQFYTSSTNRLRIWLGNTGFGGSTGTQLNDDKLHHVSVSIDRDGNATFMVDGSVDQVVNVSGKSGVNLGTTNDLNISRQAFNNTLFFNGLLDEMRITSDAKTSDWIITEYNNQSNPESFYEVEVMEFQGYPSWYDQNWNYRQKVTLENTMVSNNNQYQFPVYIDLADMNANFFSLVESDGSDIVVTMDDGVTKLKRELVDIDTGSSTGELWFKVPVLSTHQDTVFYIYYDNSSASETNDESVWSNGFTLVQHMNEDPSGSAPQMLDSTSYSNDGTTQGTMTTGDLVSGQVGTAIQFDNSNDAIQIADADSLEPDQITISTIIKTTVNDELDVIVAKDDGSACGVSGERSYMMRMNSGMPEVLMFDQCSGGPTQGTDYDVADSGNEIADDVYHHVVATWNSEDVIMMVDANVEGSTSFTGTINKTTSPVYIGRFGHAQGDYYSDVIDEVKISNVARTEDWLITEYNNLMDPATFYTIAAEESRGVCPAVDGGTNDDDSTVNGIITVQSNQTWTVEESSQGLMDCTGLDIIVKSTYTLTLAPFKNTNDVYTDDYIAHIKADNFTVESGAFVSSNELGYPGGNGSNTYATNVYYGYGPGGGSGNVNSSSYSGSGGSYGGEGIPGTTIMSAAEVYGSPREPIWLGSGGGMRASWGPGGAGGGGIILEITGTVDNDGTISADGQNSPGQLSGGGSGGSIWIDTATITGTGSITADAGDGGFYSGNYRGSGAGGRVLVEYSVNSYTGSIQANKGATSTVGDPENGTALRIDNNNTHMYISKSQRWQPLSATTFEDWFADITDITIDNSSTLYLDSTNKDQNSGAVGWDISVDNLTLGSGSSIDASELGYHGGDGNNSGGVNVYYGYGPGGGFGGVNSSSVAGAGASHGGRGSSISTVAELYGDPGNPNQPGSGGGMRDVYGPGGAGGGAIKLTVSGTLAINGDIHADGQNSPGTISGGGAGGSVWIDAGTITGSGTISADGGDSGLYSGNYRGSGGGGRVTIEYLNSSYTGNVTVDGGIATVYGVPDDGTLVYVNNTTNELTIPSTQIWLPDSVTAFEDWFPSVTKVRITSSSSYNETNDDGNPAITLTTASADYTISDTDDLSAFKTISGDASYLIVVDDNEATNHRIWGYVGDDSFSSPSNTFLIYDDKDRGARGWLGDVEAFVDTSPANWTYDIYPVTTLFTESTNRDQTSGGYGLVFDVQEFTIDYGHYIDGDELGYDEGVPGDLNGKGPGGGVGTSTAAYGGGGGSNGGDGGLGYLSNAGGSPYGDAYSPLTPGSGGGAGECAGSKSGEPGGSAVKIAASTSFTNNGKITMHGGSGSNSTSLSCRAGGGAGGSIWLDVGEINGKGTVCANGGLGGYYDSPPRGGGGGGGRIAIYFESGLYEMDACVDGTPGTYLSSSGTEGTLIISGIPTISDSRQYKQNGTTEISVGGSTDENKVVFKIDADDGNTADALTAEVELQEVGTSFTNTANLRSINAPYSGTTATIQLSTDDTLNGSWWDSSWGKAVKLTFDNSASAETLTDFPILVVINSSRLDYADTQDNGEDIRFIDSDQSTELSYEIEKWNESGDSFVWVKVPEIPSGSTTDYIWLYYDNPYTFDNQNPEDVWSNNYYAVWHMSDTATGTDAIVDSSGNLNHLTDYGSPSKSQSGQVGDSIYFDGTDDYLRKASMVSPGKPLTLEFFSYVSSFSPPVGIFDSAPSQTNVFRNYSAGNVEWWSSSPSVSLGFATSTWNHASFVLKYDTARRLNYFRDGQNISNNSGSTNTTLAWTDFTLGNINNGGAGRYNGYLDEFRISDVERSADWIEASYETSVDNFITYASAITEPAKSPYTILNDTDYHWQTRVCDDDGNCTAWESFGNNPEAEADFTTIPDNVLPIASSVTIDSGATGINLTNGVTTSVNCSGTITDADGYTDITSVQAKLFRTGVGAGAGDDDNNHYTVSGDSQCVPSNGSGNTEDYSCDFDVEFHADPTDIGVYSADDWTCEMTPSDGGGVGTGDTDTIEMNTLHALAVTSAIDYGQAELGGDTGSTNQVTVVTNQGNASIDVDVSGDDMCIDYPTCSGSVLGANYQEYSDTTFTYGVGGTDLANTSATVNLSIAKPTSSPSSATDSIYWGIGLPGSLTKGAYTGANTFTAVSDT